MATTHSLSIQSLPMLFALVSNGGLLTPEQPDTRVPWWSFSKFDEGANEGAVEAEVIKHRSIG